MRPTVARLPLLRRGPCTGSLTPFRMPPHDYRLDGLDITSSTGFAISTLATSAANRTVHQGITMCTPTPLVLILHVFVQVWVGAVVWIRLRGCLLVEWAR